MSADPTPSVPSIRYCYDSGDNYFEYCDVDEVAKLVKERDVLKDQNEQLRSALRRIAGYVGGVFCYQLTEIKETK